jgi:hypothetical protein
MKSFLRKILLGDTEITEYSTVTIEGEIKERVFFEAGQFMADVSLNHWVLCLEPIVFGVWFEKGKEIDVDKNSLFRLYFTHSSTDIPKTAKRKAVAISILDYFDQIDDEGGTLYLLKVKKSKIKHVNALKTLLLFFKYYRKPKLSFEKYKSLVAAYSYPRRVRIVSFLQGDYFNIFPMDLMGAIPGAARQVFGLRHTNVTLSKIAEAKKLVVSEIPYIYKDIIYELGKHHGGNPPSKESLPFETNQTENFGFPFPQWANSYKEIQILQTRNLGSHMLLWGKMLNEKELKASSENLYHIHFLLFYHQKLRRSEYPLV